MPAAEDFRAFAELIPSGAPIIDCDVHAVVPNIDALLPYLSAHWREHIERTNFPGPTPSVYPPNGPATTLAGHENLDGTTATAVALVREHVLDAYGSDYAILNCAYSVDGIHNPDIADAMSRAINDWIVDEWLQQDSRLRASIVVPSSDPAMAAAEIDRLGSHPGFVQVLLPVRSRLPYGNRVYLPIFEAASRHDLVVALHFGGTPGNAPTGTGWPSYYIEEYAGMAQAFQSQLMSIVIEGVFDRFEQLRLALVESGFSWLAPFMWRFDKDWKGLRRETPWLTRVPSAYIRDHVKLTTQPFDAPREPEKFAKVLDQLDSEDLLMFATDYPHWQYDRPIDALPPGVSEPLMRKLLGETAGDFYRLGL